LLVFPILPLVEPQAEVEPDYATKTLRAPSGKRVAASYRASPIDTIRVRLTLREWKTAPAGTWGTISERALVRYFFDTHRGSWDSFLLDNSTGVYQPGGISQPRVIFTSDKLAIRQVGAGLFVADVEWESVL
jgi:hypothetical protein